MIKKQRGTHDLFFESKLKFNFVVNYCEYVALNKNYKSVETPIFEDINLFKRDGDTSDIVSKELFEFRDKSDRHVSLRPEGTAPVIRMVVEEKLLMKEILPLKFFYSSAMFRYERPQSGRLRQFHQFGIEKIGIDTIYDQFEGVLLAYEIITGLELDNFTLKVNYIGNIATRSKWMNELKKYFNQHKSGLSQDSIDRIDKNPLRILDDKIDSKKQFVVDAPKIDKFLSSSQNELIKKFIELMEVHKIKYEFDKTLVRGLDYYSGIVFEIVSNDNSLKGQSTIVGGGAYEGLVSKLGGKNDVQSFGFALGIERLIIALDAQKYAFPISGIDVYIANISESTLDQTMAISRMISINGYKVDNIFSTYKLDKHFKKAEKENAKLVLIYGEKEFRNKTIRVKNQKNLIEKEIPFSNLLDEIKKQLGE